MQNILYICVCIFTLSLFSVIITGMNILSETLYTGWLWPFDPPRNFGWFHFACLGALVLVCFLFCFFFGRKHDKKTDSAVIFSLALFLAVIEIYKQIFETKAYGHYPWSIFPFQLCSVPMYLGLIYPFSKGKLRSALEAFIAFFGTLGGLAVLINIESTVGNGGYLTITLHSMIWHIVLVTMGVYLIFSAGLASSLKNLLSSFLPGCIAFIALEAVSVTANITAYNTYFGTPANTSGDIFFLFYISPYYGTPVGFIDDFKATVPYPVYLLSYTAVVILGAALIFFVSFGIFKLVQKIKKK